MLRSLITAASFSVLAVSFALADAPEDRQLTPDQIASDIALAKEAYSRIHPGYVRYTSDADMTAAWAALAAKAEASGGMTVGEFYIELQRVLTLIRCDHTKANLPKDLVADRNETPVYLPARWQLIEGRGIIYNASEESGLKPGDEILAIDGRPLAEMVAEVRPLVPYDGKTTWSVDGGIGESLEFMGGAVDHFGALLWGIQPDATLTLRGKDGGERSVVVSRVTHKGWTALAPSRAADFKDAITFERLGDNAAYLSVDTFVNYRNPVKPDTLYDPIFKSLKSENRDTLILDLRRNGGGSSDAQMRLLAHLIAKPIAPMKAICANTLNMDGLREHLWTWDSRALKPNKMGFKKTNYGPHCLRDFVDSDLKTKKPDSTAFEGKLIVLTSNENSSASASLIAILKGQRDVTLIGEKTGGSAEGPTAGLLFTLTLPESKITSRVPFLRYYNQVPGFDAGLGTKPDVKAPMTVEAYLAGGDPALKAAKAMAIE